MRYPSVPIMFSDTRPLAQEWTYRFLGAALHQQNVEGAARPLSDALQPAGPVPAPEAVHR